MSAYHILYGDTISIKDLQKIDPPVLKNIQKSIEEKLTTQPDVFGKPLRRSLKGYRRMRVGSYRVLYRIDGNNVRIVYIGKKPKVYDEFLKRLDE